LGKEYTSNIRTAPTEAAHNPILVFRNGFMIEVLSVGLPARAPADARAASNPVAH
jgi:hypothetical protein